jgi:hypothetical protein
LESNTIRFLYKYDVRRIRVELPFITYQQLKNISIDDYNFDNITGLMKGAENRFPMLNTFTIYSLVETLAEPDFRHLLRISTLTSLSLFNINTNDQMYDFPKTNEMMHLRELQLLGYNIILDGRMPAKLHLEVCIIQSIDNPQNIESLTLVGCRCKRKDDKQELITLHDKGIPTKRLILEDVLGIEDIDLMRLPRTLEEVSLRFIFLRMDQEYMESQQDLTGLRVLKKLKFVNCEGSLWFEDLPSLKELVVDYVNVLEAQRLPSSLVSLSLNARTDNEEREDKDTYEAIGFPENLEKIEMYGVNIPIRVIQIFPSSLKHLSFFECRIEEQAIIDRLPESIEELEFIECKASDIVIDNNVLKGNLRKITIIGSMPIIVARNVPEHISIIAANSDIILMGFDEFKLYCIEMTKRNPYVLYKERLALIEDMVKKDEQRYWDYRVFFYQCKFNIELPGIEQADTKGRQLVRRLMKDPVFNDQMRIIYDQTSYTLRDIRLRLGNPTTRESAVPYNSSVIRRIHEILGE